MTAASATTSRARGLPLAAGRRRRCGSTPTSRPIRRPPAWRDALAAELSPPSTGTATPTAPPPTLRDGDRRAARRRARAGLRRQRLERGAADAAAHLRRARPRGRRCSSRPTSCTRHIARLTGTDGRRGRARAPTSRSTSPRSQRVLGRRRSRPSRSCARPTTRPGMVEPEATVRAGARPWRRGCVVVDEAYGQFAAVVGARAGRRGRARSSSPARTRRRGRWPRPASATSSARRGSSPSSRRSCCRTTSTRAKQVAGRLALRFVDEMEARVAAGRRASAERLVGPARASCRSTCGRRAPTSCCSGPTERDGDDVWQALLDRVVLVRDCSSLAPPRRLPAGHRSARRPRTTRFLAALDGGPAHEPHGGERSRSHQGDDASRSRSTSTGRPARRRSAPACRSSTTCSTSSAGTAASTSRSQAKGDLEVDSHHTVEDVAHRARRGVPRGARRQGRRAPLRQRPLPARRGAGRGGARPVGPPVRRLRGRRFGEVPPARRPAVRPAAGRALLARRSPPRPASRCTSRCARGRNTHHIIEATFKGVARCLRDAVRVEGARRAVDQGRAVTAATAADRGARLRHRQPALGPEGARARRRRRPPHRRSRRSSTTPTRVVLPGVGAFGRCMEALRDVGPRRSSPLDAVDVGPAVPRHLRRHADALRGLRRGPRRRRASASCPGRSAWLPTGVKRPQMQWNLLDVRAADADCSPGSTTRPWVYFVHSLRRRRPTTPTRSSPRATTAGRSSPRSSAATCAPPSSTPRSRAAPACGCSPNFVDRRRGASTLMDLYPAIDLRGGQVVRLYQGDYDRETVYGDDPVAGRRGASPTPGAPWIHVVDLDAARTGEPVNRALDRGDRGRGRRSRRCRPAAACAAEAAAAALADAGVARVVIGHRRARGPDLVVAASPRASRSPSASTPRAARSPCGAGPTGSGERLARRRCRGSPTPASRRCRHRDRPRRHAAGPDVDGLAAVLARHRPRR